MDNDRMRAMDPYILLSWVNMKLRDEFSSLEGLCQEFELDAVELGRRLLNIGYVYNDSGNQFISIEAQNQ